MTQSLAQPTNIHPAARLAVSGLGASCANPTGGDHGWAPIEMPGSFASGLGSDKGRRDDMFGGGGMGAGAR